MAQGSSSADSPRPVILCVDDEASILSALRRLFRNNGFHVLLAESGQAGLVLLESEPVDLVISDMRMPEMNGVAFLEQVRLRWPDIPRLLLTGYADVTSIMGAINRGEIYRYIAKPWDDNDVVLMVRAALERMALEKDKKRLESLVVQQNEELKLLNVGLESTVQARTAELQHANAALNSANEHLKNNFLTSIKMFTALIEMRDRALAGHSRRVAELARRLAQALGLDKKQVQEVFVAGLLYAIGKVGFDDELLAAPIASMTPRQLETYRQHPQRAEQLLMPLAELKATADIVVAQLEHHDGSGYPQGLAGRRIAIGARILALARDYCSLLVGRLEPGAMSRAQAHAYILQHRGKLYDPVVVDAFDAVVGDFVQGDAAPAVQGSRQIGSRELRPGMVLARDLISHSGMLLLTAGHVLDATVIQKIIAFEVSIERRLAPDILDPVRPAEGTAGGAPRHGT